MTTRGPASFNPAVEAAHARKKLPQKKLQRKEIPRQDKDVREDHRTMVRCSRCGFSWDLILTFAALEFRLLSQIREYAEQESRVAT
jgi:hypothetical protein